jgi:hypothetical protein
MGLEGTEKDSFIREEAMTSLNQFISENPNKATLLGLDNHNIMKRFDQKLIKEPMKDFVREKAAELKEQGIFGKEARDKIEASVQEWAKQNLPDYIPDRKISEFMKKASMKSLIKSKAEMGASEAKNYAVNLIKEDRVDEAKQFIDKFRENAVSSELERNKKYEASKIEGGKIVKGFVGGVNIASKALRPVLLTGTFVAKKIYNWSPNITGRLGVNEGRGLRAPKGTYKEYKKAYGLKASKVVITNKVTNKKIRKFFGQVDNAVGGMKDHLMGLKIPLINPDGSPERNPRKNLRKFDRKIERELAGLFEQQEKYEDKLKKPEAYGIKEDRKQEIKKKKGKLDDVIGKLGITKQDKIEKKPTILTDFNLRIDKDDALYKKVGKGLVRIISTPLLPIVDPIYKRLFKTEQGGALKELHKDNKTQALQRVAKKNIDALQENIKNKFQERLVDKDGNLKSITEEDRDKIKENRRNRETDDLATTLKMIEKRQKKELEKKEKEYIKKNINNKWEGSATSSNHKKITEKLKQQFRNSIKISDDPNDTVLEKLIKREYAEGGKDFTLKYIQELAKDDRVNIKEALFGKAKETFDANVDFKNAFDKAVLVASDSVVAGDPTAVPNIDNVDSAKDDPKSNFDKNRIIASIIYDSIADKEFNNLKNQFHMPIEDPKADGKQKEEFE